jgi:hypothetical protein
MTSTVDSLIDEYPRRYLAGDADGVTELCLCPFVAIREGVAIRLADPDAVRDHFSTIMGAYRSAGYADFSAVSIDTRELGDRAAFTTVRWQALDSDGKVVRDTLTSYHLLATAAGWRFLSYTNHF